VFGGLNCSSSSACSRDDLWFGNFSYNNATQTWSVVSWTLLAPSGGFAPASRGLAQSWLQYENMTVRAANGSVVLSTKTTL
jgi:hypothetical protein